MIKRWIILLLAVQTAAAAALAVLLYHEWRPPLLAALPALHALLCAAFGVAAVIAVRLLLSLNNFHLSAHFGSATPDAHKLNAVSALRLIGGEFLSSLRVSTLDMLRPVGLRLTPQAQAQGLPVLLLHGYACNSGYWRPLSALLAQANISHLAIDLEPLGAGIDELAPQVQAAVQRLCAATGSAQVVIVGHSMGGLVARAWLRRYGAAQSARIVTLGSPHQGTALARTAPGRNGAQMRRGSAWLVELAAAEANLQREIFTSIYSVHDNIVAPQDSSHIPRARNLVYGGIGHVALGRHPAILAAVLDEVRQAGASQDKRRKSS